MMNSSDWLIDLGPGAGEKGGRLLFSGTPDEITKMDVSDAIATNSLSIEYLKEIRTIPVPKGRRAGNGLFLEIRGARGNNLKNIDIKIPLGCFIGVSGVSGSGKSSLINETLMPL
jgi:excinuclease ABC subunit A